MIYLNIGTNLNFIKIYNKKTTHLLQLEFEAVNGETWRSVCLLKLNPMEQLALAIVVFFVLLLFFMKPSTVTATEGFNDRPKGICDHDWELISSKKGEVRNYLTVLIYRCKKCKRKKTELK